MEWLQEDRGASHNPIDLLEELVRANDWTFERPTETELMVEVEGRWCGYYLLFIWRVDVGAVCFSCHFDQKLPARRGDFETVAGLPAEQFPPQDPLEFSNCGGH